MTLFQLQMLYGIKWDDSEWKVDKNLTDSGNRAKLYPADKGKPWKTSDSVANNHTGIQNRVLPNPSTIELNVQGYCEKYKNLYRCLQVTGVEISWLLLFKPYNVLWLRSIFTTKRLNTSLRQQRGVQWHNWFRHCTTSRKVAGLIRKGVIGIFHWHNPSGCTMALGLTQPLTEMSTRNISWGVKAANA